MFNYKTIKKENSSSKYQQEILDSALKLLPQFSIYKNKLNPILKEMLFNKNCTDDNTLRIKDISKNNNQPLNEEIKNINDVLYLASQIIYLGDIFQTIDIGNEKNILSFIKTTTELNIWQIEILQAINKEKFGQFKEKCISIYKNLSEQNNLTSPLSYLHDERQIKWFQQIKNDFIVGELEKKFEIIEDIEKNFVPYHTLDEFYLLFRIITFKENDFNLIIDKLEIIKDPFVLESCLQDYVEDLDFITALIESNNINLICFGLCEVYKYFKEMEKGYFKYFLEELNNTIKSKNFYNISKLHEDQINLKNEINMTLKEVVVNNNTGKKEYFEIIVVFLKKYFRICTFDFSGRRYYLQSFGIYNSVLVEFILESIKSDKKLYYKLKELYPFTENNILFYSLLLWNLISYKSKHNIVNEIVDFYYKNFIDKINSDELTTNFGFEYEYQINYLNSFLTVIIAGSKINSDKEYFLNRLIDEVKKVMDKFDDPILREQVLLYNKFENLKYLFLVIFELFNQSKIKNNDNKIQSVLELLDKILVEWEYSDNIKSNNNHLWNFLAKLSIRSKIARDYYYKKINSLERLLPLCKTSLKIPVKIVKKVKQNLEYDLEVLDTKKLLDYYWVVYLISGFEEIMDKIFCKLPDNIKKDLNNMHDIRKFPVSVNIKQVLILLENKLPNYNNYYNFLNYFAYWKQYFDKLNMIPEEKLLENLIQCI